MLDFVLAALYEVETKRLKEAVRRNINRFPSDFMFELTRDEYNFLRTQIASLENGKGIIWFWTIERKNFYLWFTMLKLIEDRITEIISLCKSHHVISIALFGSAAKGSMHIDSDVDFLVQFSEDLDVLDYADNYFSLLDNLEKIVGKKVDLISIKSLKNQILIEDIERSKVVLYAA